MNVKQPLIKATCLAIALSSSVAMGQTVIGGGTSTTEILYHAEFTSFPADYWYRVTDSDTAKISLLNNDSTNISRQHPRSFGTPPYTISAATPF